MIVNKTKSIQINIIVNTDNYIREGMGGRDNTTSFYKVDLIFCFLTANRHPIPLGQSKHCIAHEYS